MPISPTQQQNDARDATSTGEDVVIEALAGTGKTSTLDLIARDRKRALMTYVAFNKSIAQEAKRKFPSNVTAKTAHGFAYAHIVQARPGLMDRLSNQGRVPRWRQTQILGIPSDGFRYGNLRLRDGQLTSLVMEAVGRFCRTAATAPHRVHIPKVPGMDTDTARADLADYLFPYLERAWADLISDSGKLRFSHDVYLKLASQDPTFRLPGEVILFDEAQDADPVVMHIVRRMQAEHDAQLIVVGDSQQQIYEWRGAIDALDQFDAAFRLPLTQSFRFGPAIAEEANRILSLLPTDLRVEGYDQVDSSLAFLDDPDTVLCRTNAEAVGRLLNAQIDGVSAGLVGGTQQVEWLAKAAKDLAEGRPTDHPELRAFDNWAQVQEHVEDDKDARDLRVLVNLVDKHGPDTLLLAVERAVPEQAAKLLISTAHKAKGREWKRVKLAGDFPPPVVPDSGGQLSEGELRLQYVAATRAQELLDSSSLTTWVNVLVAPALRADRVFLEADEVPERVEVRQTVEVANVMVDPNKTNRLIMTGTKYNPDLVAAQKELPYDRTAPRERYQAEYAGFDKVRIVLASYAVLQCVERFGLTITEEARERIAEYS